MSLVSDLVESISKMMLATLNLKMPRLDRMWKLLRSFTKPYFDTFIALMQAFHESL